MPFSSMLWRRAEEFDDTPCQGCAREGGATSLSGLISTLVPTLPIAAIYIIFFLVLRKSKRRYYAPRTYLGSLREDERSPSLPNGLFNWFGAFWNIPDTYALQHQSLDAYLFLRFLRIACAVCFGGVVITWPILFPLNATGGGGEEQLDLLSMSNINTRDPAQRNKLYGHVVVAWLYYGFVLYMIMRELIYYINIRQAVMLSPMNAIRMSSRTVLFTSVPKPYLDKTRLTSIYGDAIKRIWIAGDSTEVDDLVEERNKVAMKLEKAEIKLIKMAVKERTKAIGNGASDDKTAASPDTEPGSIAGRWIPEKKRPTHRTGFLGLIGKKVDTINWCRTELERLIPQAEAAQNKYRSGDYKKTAAVFIEFANQSQAQAAYQVLTHHHALQMAPRYIGIQPSEVIWASLKLPWWQLIVRRYLVLAFITVMILFWAVPVGVVASISNITALREKYDWLSFLDEIPEVLLGVVTGPLPSIAMAILMAMVPIIMRLCAKVAGEPSNARVELFTQNAYFCFLVIHVFLLTTFSSGATAVATKIADNPGQTPSLLAENLPKASNFYITYFVIQGLAIAVSVLTQVVGYFVFTLLYKFLTGTPRAMYAKWSTLSAISWGSTMPTYSLIAVISITYAGIAPLVSGFGFVANVLFYLAFRYNILFVTDTNIDTHGLIYPRAIKHLLVGVYLAELCMIGLFGSSKAFGPFVMMIVFLVFTILFTITVLRSLNPLLYSLPQSLQVAEAQADIEAVAIPASEANKDVDVPSGSHTPPKKMVTHSPTPDEKKPNFFMKWLKPWLYQDYAHLRQLVSRDGPTDPDEVYPDKIAKDAYYPPSVCDATPLLWIPEDPAGISKQEILHTGKVIPITDEGCTMDDHAKLHWDAETTRPPIWEEKIRY